MDTQMLISVLTWAAVAAAGSLIASIVWFARRLVSQVDKLEQRSNSHSRRLIRLEMSEGLRELKEESPPEEE